MAKTLFEQIIDREIPAEIVYEDELCLAFNDINPQAPVHILIIPKQHIAKLSEAKKEHQQLLGHLMLAANSIANDNAIDDFRLIINNGAGAQQTVFHLHLHLLAARKFTWPPG